MSLFRWRWYQVRFHLSDFGDVFYWIVINWRQVGSRCAISFDSSDPWTNKYAPEICRTHFVTDIPYTIPLLFGCTISFYYQQPSFILTVIGHLLQLPVLYAIHSNSKTSRRPAGSLNKWLSLFTQARSPPAFSKKTYGTLSISRRPSPNSL